MPEPMPVIELDVAARLALFGFPCPDCGHHHAGQAVGFICIGCACVRRSPRFVGTDILGTDGRIWLPDGGQP